MSIVALRPNQPAHPLAGMTFYHGTPAKNIPGILEQGILPTTSGPKNAMHGCLTTDLHCALLFGRLTPVLNSHKNISIAIIVVPGEAIDPSTLCPEHGSTGFAYGHERPERTSDALYKLTKDWRAFFDATRCIGVQAAIPVRADWVDTRFYGIDGHNETTDDLIKEMGPGINTHPVLLERMAQAPRWLHTTEHAAKNAA